MKRLLLSFLLVLAGLGASGCSKTPPADDPAAGEPVPIPLTKADESVRDASNAFGLDVFARLYALRGGRDVAFSPLSLSLALAMAAEGAENDSWAQFRSVCGWDAVTKDDLGAFYAKMTEGLVKADPQVHFSSDNSLWAAENMDLKPDYRSLLERWFAAESYTVDFTDAATLSQINRWCSDKTDGKIPQMLEDLDPLTRLMLINALLYKAPWRDKWDLAQDRVFRGESTESRKDFIHADKSFGYADTDGFEAVRLPYGNGAYEMLAFLPKAGKSVGDILPAIAKTADALVLPERPAEVFLPKFSTAYFTGDNLNKVLTDKGLTLPFSGDADFSGISGAEALYISKVLQKVQVDVTEKGTEFAAVTVVEFRKNSSVSVPPAKVVVDFNRPFCYLIREVSSGAILLLGTLSE